MPDSLFTPKFKGVLMRGAKSGHSLCDCGWRQAGKTRGTRGPQEAANDRREGPAVMEDVYMLPAVGRGGTLPVLSLTDSHVLGYMKACQGCGRKK